MKRIAFVTTGLGAGGAEAMLHKLLGSLDRSRFTPAVFSLRAHGVYTRRLRDLGVTVHAAGLGDAGGCESTMNWLRMLRRFAPDLLHGWMYHGCLAASLASYWVGRRPPVVWGIRQSLPSLAGERRGTAATVRLLARLSRGPAAIVYNSLQGRRDHERLGFSPRRGHVIANGFDLDVWRPGTAEIRNDVRHELGLAAGAPLVGCIARFHPVKGHDVLAHAAKQLWQRENRPTFMLAGGGTSPENAALVALLSEAGVAPMFRLLGERDDVPRLTAALDVAVSASRAEGFPNAVGEALACAVPCVVTDVGDCATIVGAAGRVVPPDDARSLAEAVADMLLRPGEDRAALGRQGRQRVETHYSLATSVRSHEMLLSRLLSLPKDL